MVGLLECALAVGGLALCLTFSSKRRGSLTQQENVKLPPVYGPWYLPYAVRGLMAMIKLGMDEDGFVLSLRRDYGPVVHLPWPMRQIFVLDGPLIQKVYATPSSILSFTPIRRSMQTTVFGSPAEISQGPGLTRMFPIHAKGLSNLRLDAPVSRFARVVRLKVAELKERVESSPDHAIEINLAKWVIDVMFEAATSGLFGEEFCERAVKASLQRSFNDFDACFPLLASELLPLSLSSFIPPIAKGLKGRKTMWGLLERWVEDGMPGLDEGVIRSMAEIGLEEGYSMEEIAALLMGDLWALQANAPYIAASLVLYVLQSDLLPALLSEIDSVPIEDGGAPSISMKTLSTMPLVTSCVQETVRVNTSSFSIRVIEKDFVLSTSEGEGGFLIQANGPRVVCVTRAAHISDQLWGEAPDTWIGDRFVAQGEGDDNSARLSREMNGFGGGVSVCEGRHLATAELKTVLVLLLSNLEITPLEHVPDPKLPTPTPPKVKGSGHKGWNGLQPSRDPTRPGLAAFQFGKSDVRVRVSLRRR